MKPARSHESLNGELRPGTYRLILDWLVLPDGSPPDVRLKGPEEVLGSRFATCFEEQMRGWSFREPGRGAPFKTNIEQHYTYERPSRERFHRDRIGDYGPKFRGDAATAQFVSASREQN